MNEVDIYKIAFKMHDGHYELVAMSYGLTNAPTIFQAMMSTVLIPYLQKITLVFFNDILIYSKSLQQHDIRLE